MSEFTVQSESIDVERIMDQIRQRIKDKRDEDYTEEQIRELANVKLERFLDPQAVRSNMVEFYRKRLKEKEDALRASPQAPPTFEFDPDIIYRSSRGFSGRLLYGIRRLLNPLLKFFFNPAPIVHALTIQQEINERQAEVISQMVRTQTEFIEIAALNYEVMNNLVVEMTRLSIEMKNHKMRVESVAGRLDFDERRARSLERVVQYREGSAPAGRPSSDTASKTSDDTGGPERRRRRRRRGRRRPAGATTPTANAPTGNGDTDESGSAPTAPPSDVRTAPQDESGAAAQVAESSAAIEPASESAPAPATEPERPAPAPSASPADGQEPTDR